MAARYDAMFRIISILSSILFVLFGHNVSSQKKHVAQKVARVVAVNVCANERCALQKCEELCYSCIVIVQGSQRN